jgi:hypothetical protein
VAACNLKLGVDKGILLTYLGVDTTYYMRYRIVSSAPLTSINKVLSDYIPASKISPLSYIVDDQPASRYLRACYLDLVRNKNRLVAFRRKPFLTSFSNLFHLPQEQGQHSTSYGSFYLVPHLITITFKFLDTIRSMNEKYSKS